LQSHNNLAEAAGEYRLAIDARPNLAVARYNLAGVLARLITPPKPSGSSARHRHPADFAPATTTSLLLAGRGEFDRRSSSMPNRSGSTPQLPMRSTTGGAVLAARTAPPKPQ